MEGLRRARTCVHHASAMFRIVVCVCSAAVLVYIVFDLMPREVRLINHNLLGRHEVNDTKLHKEKLHCIQPKYELYPSAKFHDFFRNVQKPQCPGKNWTKVERGIFMITEFAKKKFGSNITCDYLPLLRGKRDFDQHFGQTVRNIQDGAKVNSVASKVSCFAGGERYVNYHITIPYDGRLQRRAERKKLPQGALGMNVLMFGFDSTSRITWQRKLPKSYAYMVDVLKCIVLKGFNTVGDGTLGALLPMFTGKTEDELPNVAKGNQTAGTLDEFPWIWKDFKNAGYVTQWTEDAANEGTFTWRMNGFKKQPMDYHCFDFYAEVERKFKKVSPYCFGAELRHNVQMNWIAEFLKVYKNHRTFSYGFHSASTHNDNKPLNIIDDDLKAWLQNLYTSEYLKNTVLILMSDHGVRFQGIRETIQGRHEERNPFFSFRLPDWFKQTHPQAYKNLQINSNRLVTPFDIYATFRHILNFRDVAVGDISERGISLFSKIPASRTCANAEIIPHWCNCMNWRSIAKNSSAVKNASLAFIDFANSLTTHVRERCHLLEIDNIEDSVALNPNKKLLEARLNHNTLPIDVIFFHLTIYTKPGGGHFEVTVKQNLGTNSFTFDRGDVSRVNTFGTAADCVVKHQPSLAWYCVCK